MNQKPDSASSSNIRPNPVKDLVLLFSIPVVIAVIAAIAVYVPRHLAHPKYDFVYSDCHSYCTDSFSIGVTGKITYQRSYNDYGGQLSDLKYFDMQTKTFRTISLAEAQNYKLNTNSKSPDGYTLEQENSDGGFLFWGNDTHGWYLKNGVKRANIMLSTKDDYYISDIKFLGWVVR